MLSHKLSIAAVLLVLAGGIPLVVSQFDWVSSTGPGKPAATGPAGPASPVSAPGATAPKAAAAALPISILIGDCLQDSLPNAADAERRAAACSAAIQSHGLTPGELALARLNRGAARMAMGDKVMASRDYMDALQHYDSMIDPANPHALALYRRGTALEALGQTDRALSDYNQAIKLDPREPLAFFGRGVLLATRKRAYVRAIADFDKVLALQPDNVAALMFRGDAYGQMGEFGRSLADLDRAIALAPDDARAYVFRGLANGRRGKDQLALDDYASALERDPRNVDALVNRAAIRSAAGKNDQAIRDLDAALAIRPDNPLALYNRGYARFIKRDYDQAIADYSAAISLDPTMGLAYNNRCLTRAIVGRDLVPALADCDMALKLIPTSLEIHNTRGFIYLKLGDPAIAITEYDKALDADPNRALSLYGRGLAKIRSGRQKEGEADQAAARALLPSVERRFSIYGLE